MHSPNVFSACVRQVAGWNAFRPGISLIILPSYIRPFSFCRQMGIGAYAANIRRTTMNCWLRMSMRECVRVRVKVRVRVRVRVTESDSVVV